MNTFTSRLYADDTDLARLIEFLPVARPANHAGEYPGATDLREMLCQPDLQVNMRLWFDQRDRLIAFALVDAYHNLLFDYDPHANSSELEEAIMQWGVTCLHAEAEDVTLDAVCGEDDVERYAWLMRHGFRLQAQRTLHFKRSLDAPIPDPRLPSGFVIRAVAGDREVDALVALHRAAFGTDHMTVEERRAMMSVSAYLPELDLAAVAPDGRLAGFCVCGISVEKNAATGRHAGYTDPVGVHPDFQKKGLARALLLTGLQLLCERGVEDVVLGTSSENAAMQAAARSAGFQLESAKVWFAKSL